jgi:hypothetical protein
MSLPSRCDGRPQSSLARASRARGCESSMRQGHRLRARSRGNLWGRQRRAGLRAALPASGAQRIRTRQPACGPALLIQRPASCRPWGVLDLVTPAEEPVMEALWTRFSALRSSDGLRGQWLSSGALSGPGPGPGRLLAGRAGRGEGGVSARGAVSLGELRQGARSFKVCAGESKSPGESRDRGQRPGVARMARWLVPGTASTLLSSMSSRPYPRNGLFVALVQREDNELIAFCGTSGSNPSPTQKHAGA